MDIITSILLKPMVEKLNFYIDSNQYWKAWIVSLALSGVIFILGYALRFAQEYQKGNTEIFKMKAEAKEKNFSNLEKLQLIRKKYLEESNLFQVSLSNLIESCNNKKIKSLTNSWNDAINLFFNNLMPSFEDYLEYCEVFNDGDTIKENSFIVDEIIPLLETILEVKKVFNNPFILGKINKPTIEINESTIKTSIRYAESKISLFNIRKKLYIKSLHKQIV